MMELVVMVLVVLTDKVNEIAAAVTAFVVVVAMMVVLIMHQK